WNRRGTKLQEGLGGLLRRPLGEDPKLVARVKADSPWLPADVASEIFTGPLAWLRDVWRRPKKPPGRPHDPARHWAIAGAMEMLMQTHTAAPAEDRELRFDSESNATAPAKAGELKAVPLGFGLTFTEAVRLLSEENPFEAGPMPPRRDGVPRRSLTGQALNALGKDLQKRIGGRMNREEIIRTRQ